MAGMTLCAAIFHLLVTLRSDAERVDLAMTATSFGVVAYELCEIGIFVAPDAAHARPFIELVYGFGFTTLGFFIIAIERYARRPVEPWAYRTLVVAIAFGLLCVINPRELALTNVPSTLVLHFGEGAPIVIHEVLPGPLVSFTLFFVAFIAVRVVILSRILFREGDRPRAIALAVCGGLFAASLTSDYLVFQRLYAFIYLSEYSYSLVVLLMIGSSTQEVAAARRTERRLKASDERLRATLTSIGDAVLVVDERNIVTDLNPAAERIFGERAKVVGEHLRVAVEATMVKEQDLVEATRRDETLSHAVQGVVRVRGMDGVERVVDCKGTPLRDHDDVIVGSVLVYRDVTDQRRLEDRLRRAERLESIGRLAGGVAHDLNNMLAPIMGFAQIAQKKLPLDHPVRPLTARIEEASGKAAELTRQLLAMGRRQTLQVRPLRVGEIVAELVPMLGRVLPEDFTLDVHDAAPDAWVRGDRNELERVILNLVLNARDAMARGGTIELRTAVITLDKKSRSSGSGVYVRMSVRDHGHGMDKETQTLIFEPFFTTKALGRGTGLGLATVQGVVEQHGGLIEVESEVGRGSTFHVYFPLAMAPRDSQIIEPLPSGETPLDGGGSTVLLVEDDALVRKLAHDVLADAGFDVLVAIDGERAIELASNLTHHIDLLLTDVIMPRTSGPELARVLRDSRPDLRVLYMSGHPADELGARGLVERDVDLLRKPFGIEELVARVVRAMRISTPR